MNIFQKLNHWIFGVDYYRRIYVDDLGNVKPGEKWVVEPVSWYDGRPHWYMGFRALFGGKTRMEMLTESKRLKEFREQSPWEQKNLNFSI